MKAVDFRRHRVKNDAAELYVVDEGDMDAPCVVLGHSIMTDMGMWAPQRATLLDLGLRVIRYDCLGHGLSPALPPPYTITQLSGGVISILDALNIERAHYMGLSLGGIVAWDLAANHGKRLASLVVADAPVYATTDFATVWDARIQTAMDEGMGALVAPTMSRWFGPEFLAAKEPIADSVREMIRNTSVDGFSGAARALQVFDYRSHLAKITLPTTIIVGEHDGVLPLAMNEIADQIAGSDYVCVPSARHLPNVEFPDLFNEALRRHFQDTIQAGL